MPIEDQVVQVYAATSGYLDRIVVDKVERFLGELTEWVRGNEPDLLKQIAEGDWSDETQKRVEDAVSQFAEDFGYDLDEEGHPLEEDGEERGERDGSSDGGERSRQERSEGQEEEEGEEKGKEEEPVTA